MNHNQIAIIVMYADITSFFNSTLFFMIFRVQNSIKFYPTLRFEILIFIERIAIKKIFARLDILLIEIEI